MRRSNLVIEVSLSHKEQRTIVRCTDHAEHQIHAALSARRLRLFHDPMAARSRGVQPGVAQLWLVPDIPFRMDDGRASRFPREIALRPPQALRGEAGTLDERLEFGPHHRGVLALV
jgi:hypothetical protein